MMRLMQSMVPPQEPRGPVSVVHLRLGTNHQDRRRPRSGRAGGGAGAVVRVYPLSNADTYLQITRCVGIATQPA
jgi:hypothetical protein